MLKALHTAQLALQRLPARQGDLPDLNPAFERLRAWRVKPSSWRAIPVGAICVIDGDPLRESLPALRALLEAIDEEVFGPMGARKGARSPQCLFAADCRRMRAVDVGRGWRPGTGGAADGFSPLWEERAREQQLADYSAMCGVPAPEVKALVETLGICSLVIWGKARSPTVAGRELNRLVSSGWYRLAAKVFFASDREGRGAPEATAGSMFMPAEQRVREIATCAKLLQASADLVAPAVSILGMYAIGTWAGAKTYRSAGHELLRSADLLVQQASFLGTPIR